MGELGKKMAGKGGVMADEHQGQRPALQGRGFRGLAAAASNDREQGCGSRQPTMVLVHCALCSLQWQRAGVGKSARKGESRVK